MASFSDPPVDAAPRFGGSTAWPFDRRSLLLLVPRRRYAVALAVAAPVVALAIVRFGASGRAAVAAFFITSLCLAAAADVAERRLPNRIVLPSFVVILAAQTALYPDRALEWILAAVGGSAALLLAHLANPSGLGFGDVKLALVLGAALGAAVVAALVVASLAAAAYAAVLLVRTGGAARHTAIPFGPFLAFGAFVALFLQ